MFVYSQLRRVFPGQPARAGKQAPWRVQTQIVAAVAVFAVVLAAIGGLYLATASRAATAGRDVQRLEAQKADLVLEIDQLEAEVASAMSLTRMQARAGELGFAPAHPEQIEFIVVAGYPAPRSPWTARPGSLDSPPGLADTARVAAALAADYDETFTSWLARQMTAVLALEP